MEYVLFVLLIALLLRYDPYVDKTEDGELLLWYTSKRGKTIERDFIRLYKKQ